MGGILCQDASVARIPPRYDENRLFVREGWRHYRPYYSRAEVWWGLMVLAMLVAIATWVFWRGVHPDPALFAAAPSLTRVGAKRVDREAIPTGLALADWREGSVAHFGSEDLYVKINGRAGYFKSFGFRRLHFVSLQHRRRRELTVDVELYDLGKAINAIGAYTGERPKDAPLKLNAGSLGHRSRNALFLAHGRFYLRAIGSAEDPRIANQLDEIERVVRKRLPGAQLPWAYRLFVQELSLKPSVVKYVPKDAFSFEFATRVFSARLADETQLFVSRAASREHAERLAKRYLDAFLGYGKREHASPWVKDRYIGSFSTAINVDRWVAGIRGAPKLDQARMALRRLQAALVRTPQPQADDKQHSESSVLESDSGGSPVGYGDEE